MISVLVLNGPNLNALGRREPAVYGTTTYDELNQYCRSWGEYLGLKVSVIQSNHEGVLIDTVHRSMGVPLSLSSPPEEGNSAVNGGGIAQGIIINAGGFSHTSVALADCLASFSGPTICVHISNIHARESFRHRDLLAPVVRGCIVGLGIDVYRLALIHLKAVLGDDQQPVSGSAGD